MYAQDLFVVFSKMLWYILFPNIFEDFQLAVTSLFLLFSICEKCGKKRENQEEEISKATEGLYRRETFGV